ncbi:hypothetical protein D3C87_1612130 [compost metagenome]
MVTPIRSSRVLPRRREPLRTVTYMGWRGSSAELTVIANWFVPSMMGALTCHHRTGASEVRNRSSASLPRLTKRRAGRNDSG